MCEAIKNFFILKFLNFILKFLNIIINKFPYKIVKNNKIDITVLRQKAIKKIKSSTSYCSASFDENAAIIINYQPFLLLLNLKQQADLDEEIVKKILTEKKQILENIENKAAKDFMIKSFISVETYYFVYYLLLRINAGVFDEKLKQLDKKGKLD